jgi:hypothetical protein
LQQIIDARADPEAKSRLLSGQLNAVVCPHCGFRGALNSPFLYHDAELELALVYMPLDLGTTDADRQRAIGDLTNRLMQQLPPEERKGYLLQPRTHLSVESLIEALLEADEETRELVEMQRRKIELLEELQKLDPEDSLAMAEFIGANDEEIDEPFLQLMDVVISIAESQGEPGESNRLEQLRTSLMDKSTTGRRLKAQQAAVEALTADPTRETLIEQLVANDDRAVREALITVGRQLLDYAFFQTLTARIDAVKTAGDSQKEEQLVALRKEVQEIRDHVDTMAMAMLDARATLLRDLMLAEDPQEMMVRHVLEIDDAFLGVLATNIQQAEAEGRQDLAQQLRQIGDMAIQVLTQFSPPEIQLINRIASAETDEQVRQLLEGERERVDQEFLQLVERAVNDLEQTERKESAERLRYAAQQIQEILAG